MSCSLTGKTPHFGCGTFMVHAGSNPAGTTNKKGSGPNGRGACLENK